MSTQEELIQSIRDTLLFSKEGKGFLQRLWSSGQEGSGTFVLTSQRILFIQSKGAGQRLGGSPNVESVSQADQFLSAQGGFAVPRSALTSTQVSASGSAGYAYGQGSFSDLTIRATNLPHEKTFRFFGKNTASDVLRLLRLSEAPAPVSPIAAEFAELGIPLDYGLPAPPDRQMQVTWYRATLGFAYRTLKKGEPDLAIRDATLLIDDADLRSSPQYARILAAAYYVCGLAYERKGDKAQATLNYRGALDHVPSYELAARALERIQ
jgi:hypothetical protein